MNGVERPYTEEDSIIHDWQTTTKKEAAAATDNTTDNDEFEWILPEQEKQDIPEFKIIHAAEPQKKPPFSRKWGKKLIPGIAGLVMSVLLAVIVGLLLGTFFLKMMDQGNEVALNEPLPQKTATSAPANNQNKTYTVQLPSSTIAILQGGVFSSEEAAKTAAQEFLNNNLPTVVDEVDHLYYVYIGIAKDITTAKKLSALYKEQGIEDVWAKELSLDKKQFAVPTRDEVDIVTYENELFFLLAGESVRSQVEGEINHEALDKEMKKISPNEKITNENKDYSELRKTLHSAVASMEKLKASPTNQADFLTCQQALLDYLLAYKGMGN